MEELLTHGIDRLSIVEVAKRAGMHGITVYPALAHQNEPGRQRHREHHGDLHPRPDTGSLRDDLRALLSEIAHFVQSPEGGLLLQLAARKDLPEYTAAREYFDAERFALGTAVLGRTEVRGEIRHGIDRRLVMELLIGPLHVRALLTGGPL